MKTQHSASMRKLYGGITGEFELKIPKSHKLKEQGLQSTLALNWCGETGALECTITFFSKMEDRCVCEVSLEHCMELKDLDVTLTDVSTFICRDSEPDWTEILEELLAQNCEVSLEHDYLLYEEKGRWLLYLKSPLIIGECLSAEIEVDEILTENQKFPAS